MTTRGRFFAIGVFLAGGVGMTSGAPDTPFPRTVTNLKVLAADTPSSHLKRIMRGYEADLGVTCSYCHVEDRDTGIIDYASDENTRKHTARVMIEMLETINGKYLAQLGGDRRYAVPVTCGSCHLGRSNPQAFEER